MSSKSVMFLIASILSAGSFGAYAQDNKQLAAEVIEEVAKEEKNGLVKSVRPLPMTNGILAIEDRNGNTIFSSFPNARFQFKGVIYDSWTRKTIKTVQDVHDAYTVPLEATGVIMEDLSYFVIGNKEIPKSGTIFVDPIAESTATYLQKILQEKDKYNFDVVLMGTKADGSVQRLKTLWCTEDQELAIASLISGDNSTVNAKKRENCDPEPMVRAAVAQQLLHINGTPHTIRNDGLFYQGVPENIGEWLGREFKLVENK